MSCTDVGPFDGGIYNDPQINDPQIIHGVAEGITLEGNTQLDEMTASNILKQIQALNPETVTDDPRATDGTDLPTTIVGEDRSVVLGKPAGFFRLGGFMIPFYRAE